VAWEEIDARFGTGPARRHLAGTLRHLHALAIRTGHLEHFLIFGSFVTNKEQPGDVDIVLVMAEEFRVEEAPRESQTLFSHAEADARFGASVFWVRRGLLLDGEIASVFGFLADPTGWRQAGDRGGSDMIRNDAELNVNRERVAALEQLLQTLRPTARPEEWAALSSGYRLEIERMQGEIMDYLVQGAPPVVSR
jgi:hypothetical protein